MNLKRISRITNCSDLEDDDLELCLDECLKMLDENVNILSNIEYELNQQKEDELVPDMQLTDLMEMSKDITDS